MNLPRFVRVEQQLPNRAISDIPSHIARELKQSGVASDIKAGARIAIGVGSRGISNTATIVKAVVEFWKQQGAQPFIFPAMGSHGAATAEGQADVLAHYGIHEATLGVPVISSLEVEPAGKTQEGIETFIDKKAYESDGIFLIGRVKWHTDFSGRLESGLYKMMAIGLGKFAGARQYHTFAYRLGLEQVIRSAGSQILSTGKVLGGLAIQEGAHHETAGLTAINFRQGQAAVIAEEERLLAEVKSWRAKLPVPEVDGLIIDEIGKNISGAGMDTKVINRSIQCQYNPFDDIPKVHRIYVRGLSALTYHSAVGVGMADVIHDRLLNDIDWKPTYINSLTASTPSAIRTPIHFPNDVEALMKIGTTVGKTDLADVTFCRIRNTLELVDLTISENLIPSLFPHVRTMGEPFTVRFDHSNDLLDDAAVEDRSSELSRASLHQ